MTTMTVPRTPEPPVDSKATRSSKTVEPTAAEIISQAKVEAAPARGAWLMSGATALLTWAAFTPLDWGPLGWICLVPVLMLIRLPRRTRWMYRAIYATAFIGMLASLQWMRLGDASMYPAWIALSFYMALYLPVFVGVSRLAVHKLCVPLVVAAPIVWVGLEFAQAHLMTGFSWYYLGHTQYYWLNLIQISDIVGAYGVSFVVAMSAAALTALIPGKVFAKLRLLPENVDATMVDAANPSKRKTLAVVAASSVFLAAFVYGQVRRSQATWTKPDARRGPRVALIQGNFPISVKHDPNQRINMLKTHDMLTGMAVKHQPDVIVWPETMFGWPLPIIEDDLTNEELLALTPPPIRANPQFDPEYWIKSWRHSDAVRRLTDDSERAGTATIIGISTRVARKQGLASYNSAVLVKPGEGVAGRYDKVHRVIFGEYIPLREELPVLQKFSPYAAGFGIDAGRQVTVFEEKGWTFAPVICFEDTVPHLVRQMVKESADSKNDGKTVDVLVNLTNDGWFKGSSELDQHLITSVFRAVECRTPMVRAVNTGISAYIDGDGAVVEPEVYLDKQGKKVASIVDPDTGRWRKSLDAALVHKVPLDERTSLYVRHGDWFASGCLFATLLALCVAVVPRRRTQSAA